MFALTRETMCRSPGSLGRDNRSVFAAQGIRLHNHGGFVPVYEWESLISQREFDDQATNNIT